MKKTLLFLFFTSTLLTTVKAQVTDLITGLNSAYSLTIDGDMLYYTDYDGVYAADLTQDPVTPQTLDTSIAGFKFGMLVHNNTLYFTNEGTYTLYSLDLSTTGATPVAMNTFGNYVQGLFIENDILYIGGFTALYSMDLTQPSPTPTTVVSGFSSTFGITIKGSYLYVTDLYAQTLYAVDYQSATPTATAILTGMYVIDVFLEGTELYVTDYNYGNIYHLDTTDNSYTTVATGFSNPLSTMVYNGNFYSANYGTSSIAYTANTFANEQFNTTNTLTVHPNPATNVISIANLQQATQYEMYSIDGKKVMNGTITPNTNISISPLAKGTYILKTANGLQQKVIKL